MKYLSLVLVYVCSCVGLAAFAQTANTLHYREYLQQVKNANLHYLAEKYNVDIAQANVQAAKVLPDPELSFSYENEQKFRLRHDYEIEAELSYTFELGGKRKARVELAKSEKEMTEALLDDYFQQLRAEATIVYLTALKQNKLHQIQKSSYQQMKELARADSLRFKLGSIMEVDALQSSLEATSMLNEVYASEVDLNETLLQLSILQGDKNMQVPDSLTGKLQCCFNRQFELSSLVVSAQNNRADLRAALKSKDVSARNLRLAQASRAMDIELSLGGIYAAESVNGKAGSPSFTGVLAGISIPLKFSNFNKGEVRAARLAAQQNQLEYEAIELQIAAEVAQALKKYQTSCKQVQQFDSGMLEQAKLIYNKKVYSYQRGETSILELLDAQRTYNEIQVSYTETLLDCAVSLVELERATGIWDIEID